MSLLEEKEATQINNELALPDTAEDEKSTANGDGNTAGKEHSFAHIFVVCADAFVNDLLANQGQAAALIAKMEELAGFRDPYASHAVSLRVSVCSSACFSCSVLGSVRALASRVQRALFAVAVKHTQMLSAAVAGVFRSVSLSVFHSLVCCVAAAASIQTTPQRTLHKLSSIWKQTNEIYTTLNRHKAQGHDVSVFADLSLSRARFLLRLLPSPSLSKWHERNEREEKEREAKEREEKEREKDRDTTSAPTRTASLTNPASPPHAALTQMAKATETETEAETHTETDTKTEAGTEEKDEKESKEGKEGKEVKKAGSAALEAKWAKTKMAMAAKLFQTSFRAMQRLAEVLSSCLYLSLALSVSVSFSAFISLVFVRLTLTHPVLVDESARARHTNSCSHRGLSSHQHDADCVSVCDSNRGTSQH